MVGGEVLKTLVTFYEIGYILKLNYTVSAVLAGNLSVLCFRVIFYDFLFIQIKLETARHLK